MDKKENSKSPILIAHLADVHLRDTQYNSARRGRDFFDAAKEAVYKACEKADLIVMVGDIFDRSRPGPRVIKQFMELHRIIEAQGKTCLASTGNHDWCSPTWLSTLLGDCPDGDVSSRRGIVPFDDTTGVTFRGYSFASIYPYTASGFRNNLADVSAKAAGADVVLYHGLVQGIADLYTGEDSNPLHVDEFPILPTNKAWLLGDIHIQKYIDVKSGKNKCLVGYPGSIQVCGSDEDKRKSVPIIELSEDGAKHVESVSYPVRPFVSGDIKSKDDLDRIVNEAKSVAGENPTVVVRFDREITETVGRIHAVLNPQESVIRCHVLPKNESFHKRETRSDEDDDIDVVFFLERRFKDKPDLSDVAVDMLRRGVDDGDNIMAEFIENRLAEVSLREED